MQIIMALNKKVQKGIAQAIKIIGFKKVSKDIRKAKTKSEVVRNVNFVLNIHKCSKDLIDPITRKRTKNPGYKTCTKFNKQLKGSTKFL